MQLWSTSQLPTAGAAPATSGTEGAKDGSFDSDLRHVLAVPSRILDKPLTL